MADTLDLRSVKRCPECIQRFGVDGMFCPFDGAMLVAEPWDPSRDPLLGRLVDGRYQVVGVLGEGGMGTVYEVRHVALDRSFAMKVLRKDLARDPDLCARFMREANATATVKHPNVVQITDFGTLPPTTDGTTPYFVMELLRGQTLARAIKAGGALPPGLAVRIALKIAAGLGAAHDARIVHRDLKPDNVFVLGSPAGVARDVDVRVVDFGAALVIGTNRVTKTGVVFGTPHYMSPEQASGQPVDHRADVYALGVILYEMFAGRVPFVADTYMGVLTQHMFVKPVPPSQISESARHLGALEEVTLRALEKKPEHRYSSMAELAADIERASSFSPDGTLRVEPTLGASSTSRPLFPLADALEVRTRDEAEGTVTKTSTRRRRARARHWVLYGGIALGVAAGTLALLRLLPRPSEEGGAGAAPVASAAPVAPPASPPPLLAAPPPSPAVVSAAVVAPSLDTIDTTTAAGSAPSPRSASRPPRTAPPAKRPTKSADGDFADPWAKSK